MSGDIKMPKIAFFKLTSCAGCQVQFLNLEDELLDILDLVDVSYFVMAKRENIIGNYDVSLVEGAVSTPEEIGRIKEIRKKSKILVAFGACACYGGIPSMKNFQPQREVERLVYEDLSRIKSTKAYGIDEYVPVDFYLRGCPAEKEEIIELLTSILLGKTPYFPAYSVCMECKLAENECLLLKGEFCLGPVTRAGCRALCPSFGKGCEGCRGAMSDPNADSFIEELEKIGIKKGEAIRRLIEIRAMEIGYEI
jgi:coenzyme F420-reducing hydrogenase gamma subunit